MRYPIASTLTPALLGLLLVWPSAHAQIGGSLGGGLDNFSLGSTPQNTRPQSLDGIAAVVNGDVILESELDEAVAQVRQQGGAQFGGNTAPNVLRSQVLDQLIMRQLQIQRAEETNIQVTPAELQQGIGRIAQRNNMNMQQFTQAVSQSGMSMDALRERVRQEIMVSKVRRQQVMGQVSVSDADVDRYLQNQALRLSRTHEYQLREIRIDLPQNADDTTVGVAHNRLEQLRQRITSGDLGFAEAARQVSDADSASQGGETGWVSGRQLPDDFDAALAGLTTGQISEVFRSQNGMYLVQLEDERGGQADQSSQEQVMVTEADMQHIVLQPNEIRNAQRTRELAQTIRDRLSAGDDFGALARQYSDDSATANQGGDVGWIPLDRLSPSTRRNIQDLDSGEISRVFQTDGGYEIVKVNGKRQRDQTQQAQRNEVRQTLGRQRATEQGNLWLRRLRDEAYVDIRMPNYQPTPDSGS